MFFSRRRADGGGGPEATRFPGNHFHGRFTSYAYIRVHERERCTGRLDGAARPARLRRKRNTRVARVEVGNIKRGGLVRILLLICPGSVGTPAQHIIRYQ